MSDILHRVGIKSSASDTYRALTTRQGLAGWWTTDTRGSCDLKQEGEQTTVLFKHQGWKEQSEFMHHCSTKWASFLLSMKSLIEGGKGMPFPDDVHISINWD